jgi:hypothetical protein
MTDLWISSSWATGLVVIDDEGIITDTAPVWKKFRGQAIESLTGWLKRKSEVKVVELPKKKCTMHKIKKGE